MIFSMLLRGGGRGHIQDYPCEYCARAFFFLILVYPAGITPAPVGLDNSRKFRIIIFKNIFRKFWRQRTFEKIFRNVF